MNIKFVKYCVGVKAEIEEKTSALLMTTAHRGLASETPTLLAHYTPLGEFR